MFLFGNVISAPLNCPHWPVLVLQVSLASLTPTSEGPFITGTTPIFFLLIASHTAVKKNPSKVIKSFYSLCTARTTTHSYWFCLLCNHFGIHAWLGPPSIHHLSCNVNKDLGRMVAALSTPPHRSMGISQAGGWNQAGTQTINQRAFMQTDVALWPSTESWWYK